MKWLSYIWHVAFNVVCVFIAIYDRNTTLIISTIGLVYTAMRGGALVNGLTLMNFAPALLTLDRIAAAVVPGYVAEEVTPRELEQKRLEGIVKLSINSVGLSIISLICILQFFSAL